MVYCLNEQNLSCSEKSKYINISSIGLKVLLSQNDSFHSQFCISKCHNQDREPELLTIFPVLIILFI